MSPYNLQHYVAESEATHVKDYAVLAHTGHGVNSYAIHYYIVQSPLHKFLQLFWGEAYMDAKETFARIRECFSMADPLVTAVRTPGRFQADKRLLVVGSDLYRSY